MSAPARRLALTVPVIALTAEAMSGDRERLLALGTTDYLPKPINRAELIAKVNRYLGGPARESSGRRHGSQEDIPDLDSVFAEIDALIAQAGGTCLRRP